MSSRPPLSFIAVLDLSQRAVYQYASPSCFDLLGYQPSELVGHSGLDLVHPEEWHKAVEIHYDAIRQEKAATLAYMRVKHKDPSKGYILCAIQRTVVHDRLVGSVSLAVPGRRAERTASTAREVTILTPYARNFELRRWDEESPLSASPLPSPSPASTSPSSPSTATQPLSRPSTSQSSASSSAVQIPSYPPELFESLAPLSARVALIIDRFSINCGILHCTNDIIVSSDTVLGRSFFHFVSPDDDALVRGWVELVKTWGVNERGHPDDGGFGFGRFTLLPSGRSGRDPLSGPQRVNASRTLASMASARRAESSSQRSSPPREIEVLVDAIFSSHSDGILVILKKV